MLVSKDKEYPSGAPESSPLGLALALTHNHFTMLERLGSIKHSSLLRKFEKYNYEKFYNIGTLAQYYETFYIRNLRVYVTGKTF
jgi:hypothetical protein